MNKKENTSTESPDSVFLKRPSPILRPTILTNEEYKGFVKQKPKEPRRRFFIKSYDPNNMNDQDLHDCNPKVSAVMVGLKWSF